MKMKMRGRRTPQRFMRNLRDYDTRKDEEFTNGKFFGIILFFVGAIALMSFIGHMIGDS